MQKVYLDTNLILDLFLSQARALKTGTEAQPTKKFEFFVTYSDRFAYVISVLTKAEVVRELISAYSAQPGEVEDLWIESMRRLKAIYVPTFTVTDELVSLAYRLRLRLRTLMNLQHLFIAQQENAWFASGDKDIVEKIRKNGLAFAVTYPELRELVDREDGGQSAPERDDYSG